MVAQLRDRGLKRQAEVAAEDSIASKKAKPNSSKTSEVSVVRKLGNGVAGTTNLVEEKITKKLAYVMKEYDNMSTFEREKRILERLQLIDGLRNRIPAFFGERAPLRGIQDPRKSLKALAFEYIRGKTLCDSLPDLKPGELDQVRAALEKTLKILRVNKTTHGDIQGNKVLIRSNTELSIADRVVLIDFSRGLFIQPGCAKLRDPNSDLRQLNVSFGALQKSQEKYFIQQLSSAMGNSAEAVKTFIAPFLATPPRDTPTLKLASNICEYLTMIQQTIIGIDFLKNYSPTEPDPSAYSENPHFVRFKLSEARMMRNYVVDRSLPLYRQAIPTSIRLLGCCNYYTILGCVDACEALIMAQNRSAAVRLACFALRLAEPLTELLPGLQTREDSASIGDAKLLTSRLIKIIRECVLSVKDIEARSRIQELLKKLDSGSRLPLGQCHNDDKDMTILFFDQIWGDA